MTLGEKISALRRQRGMSQKQLAEMLMISPQAVSRWENGENTPDVENILRLSEILDVSTDYLLKNGETMATGEAPGDEEERKKNGFSFSIDLDGLEDLKNLKELKELKNLKNLKNLDEDDNIVIRNGKIIRRGRRRGMSHNIIIKNINRIAVLSFLVIGFGWGLWHPGWLILVAAWAIKAIYNIVVNKSLEGIGFGSLAILIFFVMGLGWGLWHPGWLVFLVAGLLDSLLNEFRRSRRHGGDGWDDDDDD